jgi:CBS domain-containing membrane protein
MSEKLNDLAVQDLMTTGVFAVLPDDDLSELRQLMSGWRVRHAPVVDESNAILGVISDRDLLRHTALGRPSATEEDVAESLRRLRVKDVMTADVETARPDDPAAEAAQRMLEHKIGCLPVVDERSRLVGILTEADFVAFFAEEG